MPLADDDHLPRRVTQARTQPTGLDRSVTFEAPRRPRQSARRGGDLENAARQRPHIMELIANAPWREAVTYRETWPHEYVVVKKDGQEELLAAFCERIERGEGVECQFFHQRAPVPLPRRLQVLDHGGVQRSRSRRGRRGAQPCAPVPRPGETSSFSLAIPVGARTTRRARRTRTAGRPRNRTGT